MQVAGHKATNNLYKKKKTNKKQKHLLESKNCPVYGIIVGLSIVIFGKIILFTGFVDGFSSL